MKKNNAQSIGDLLPLRIIRRAYPVLEKTAPRVAHKIAYNLFFTPIRFKTPSREAPILEVAEKHVALVNNKNTVFYSWGNPNDPLVVLVHGWMGRASQLYKLIEKLVESQYYVVAFDGPAHGASSGIQTNITEFSEALKYIETHYGPIFYGVGHSYGGRALIYACSEGLKLKNLIFIATPSISQYIVKQFEEKLNASPATGKYFLKKVFKRHGVEFKDVSASELIQKVEIKRLFLVHDEKDKDVPIEHAQLMEERFPEAKTLYTKGLGHTRILRNDDVIKQVVLKIDQIRPSEPKG
jgi:pimeloyl-ACP methyl ester carboxylesterase